MTVLGVAFICLACNNSMMCERGIVSHFPAIVVRVDASLCALCDRDDFHTETWFNRHRAIVHSCHINERASTPRISLTRTEKTDRSHSRVTGLVVR